MKKILSVLTAATITFSSLAMINVSAAEETTPQISFETEEGLYAHGLLNSSDTEAWQKWQDKHDKDRFVKNTTDKYFFLPTSADDSRVDIYNAYSQSVTINNKTIEAGKTETVDYSTNETYSVTVSDQTYNLRFMKSTAEAGVYINKDNAGDTGYDLMTYLNANKSYYSDATGAIVSSDGSVDNTAIKKIKGRGNTSWSMAKKGYNITYTDKVSVGGMKSTKKYSILANFQDDSLSRNRVLYDLSDAVGMPYASDSRYVDFYANGYYWGSYLMCEKVEAGKSSLIDDIDTKAYLNADGTVNKDFPFVCEIDTSAKGDDNYVLAGGHNKITIKSPELEEGDAGYEEVRKYVKEKFDELYFTARNKKADLSEIADISSISKLYLINELGKNWDSGVSSTFFVWKQDKDGKYKFFGSPVWDYDNSLGNALGTKDELNYYGVTDYEKYTGWWCKHKYKGSWMASSQNLITCFAMNESVMQESARVWFDSFVPALDDFYGVTNNGIMKPKEFYYNTLVDSAEMNYASGWSTKSNAWVARHTSLTSAEFDNDTKKMVLGESESYSQKSFTDMFNYAFDWMHGRAAWLSEQLYKDYILPDEIKGISVGDVDMSGGMSINDVTAIQQYLSELKELSSAQIYLADYTEDNQLKIEDATTIQRVLAEMIAPRFSYDNIEPELREKLLKEKDSEIEVDCTVTLKNNSEENIEKLLSLLTGDMSDYNEYSGMLDATYKEVLSIAKAFGDEIYIAEYVADYSWLEWEVGFFEDVMYSEHSFKAELEEMNDTDKISVAIAFGAYDSELCSYELSLQKLIKEYFDEDTEYIFDNSYCENVIAKLTKAQINKIHEDSNKLYCVIGYYEDFVDLQTQKGIQSEVLLKDLETAEPDRTFDTIIVLREFDDDKFTFNTQRDYILSTYCNNTKNYNCDLSSLGNIVDVKLSAESIRAIVDNDENIAILDKRDYYY